MAHPGDVTMASLALVNSSAIILRVGEGDAMGQISEVTIRGTIPTEKVSRIGDTASLTIRKTSEFSVDIRMFAGTDYGELAEIITGTEAGGVGGVIELNPSIEAFDMAIDIYSSAGLETDTLTATITVEDFVPASLELPISGDANAIWSINGQCTRWYLTPAEEVIP